MAAASLLTDYVLTVAVSVSAGVAAIVSAVPELVDHRVEIGLVLIALLTVANLRGVKESGQVFAIPTYVYILILGTLMVWGLVDFYFGNLTALPTNEAGPSRVHPRQGGRGAVGGDPLRPDAGLLIGCGGPHRCRSHQSTLSRHSSGPSPRTPPGP